jgi:DNA polymerase-3 subunit alpha
VPFKEFEKISPGSFIRAAFLIETVQIKISSKSQKKFAILMISDGLEQFELPVWPELYEERGSLLRENQMLYGILQLETREGRTSLQARFFDDLSLVDEEKIKNFYDLFDRLSARSSTPSFKQRQTAGQKPRQQQEEPAQHLFLKIDADQIRLSQILALKRLFREHPGPSRVEIKYFGEEKLIGTLEITSPWGVQLSDTFKEKLSSFEPAICRTP